MQNYAQYNHRAQSSISNQSGMSNHFDISGKYFFKLYIIVSLNVVILEYNSKLEEESGFVNH